MSTRREHRRWQAASLLNRLPFTCWSRIVTWALGYGTRLWDRGNQDDIRQDWICRAATQSGRCYCGKLAVERERADR